MLGGRMMARPPRGGEFGDGLWETEERGEERPCMGPAISGQWTREHLCG